MNNELTTLQLKMVNQAQKLWHQSESIPIMEDYDAGVQDGTQRTITLLMSELIGQGNWIKFLNDLRCKDKR